MNQINEIDAMVLVAIRQGAAILQEKPEGCNDRNKLPFREWKSDHGRDYAASALS